MINLNGRFFTQEITGVQRFAYEIGRRLSTKLNDLVFLAPNGHFQSEYEAPQNLKRIGRFKGHIWEQGVLPFYLRRNDILLNLTSTAPLAHKTNVLTLHDVNFKRFPESFSNSFRLFYEFIIPQLLKKSLHVITVSEFSKTEIIEFYDINPEKISVVYNASSLNPQQIIQENVAEEEEKYIFALSSFNRNKNFENLIRAFLKIKHDQVHLFIAGTMNSGSFSQINLPEDMINHPRIKLLGRVSDAELLGYYKNAEMFVFPSLYEGFGIPPLEAQSVGCPIIVSNTASLPEIYKDSALYCDPYSIENIKGSIEILLEKSELRKVLVQKGYENTKRYNWEESSEQVLEVLKKVT